MYPLGFVLSFVDNDKEVEMYPLGGTPPSPQREADKMHGISESEDGPESLHSLMPKLLERLKNMEPCYVVEEKGMSKEIVVVFDSAGEEVIVKWGKKKISRKKDETWPAFIVGVVGFLVANGSREFGSRE